MLEIFNCEQGTPDWFACRLGLPTASEFATVMAKGKDGGASVTRARYLRDLAGEIYCGTPEEETYTNAHMERGKRLEDEARQDYAFRQVVDPIRVGFIRDGRKGCSPDSLIGDDGGLEIKTALRHIQIDRLRKGGLPPEHKAQVQGSLWVTGRAYWDFVSYSPGLPPLIVTVERDELYIATIEKAVDAFNEELDALVASIRTYENFRAAAAA